jgi:5-methylcytosine-specific restriction enzyme subunit McrC
MKGKNAKWKVLKVDKPFDADIKQMFVYNLHYDTALSILLYPKTSLETSEKKPFKNELFKDRYCQVAFTDLFNNKGLLDNNLGIRIYNDLLKEELEDSTKLLKKKLN